MCPMEFADPDVGVKPTQIRLSPYEGPVDLSALAPESRREIDRVSVADVLRNAFVCPPHSIFRGLKLQTLGFAGAKLHSEPEYSFPFRQPQLEHHLDTAPSRLVEQYHHLLCGAVARSTAGMKAPWMFQSGGKDSTSLAIALAEGRPDAVCLTYLGGREENEVDSARAVAHRLGLRHEALVCEPGRAYDHYLGLVPSMPLLTADFATLSYADMVTFVSRAGGDGIIDGLGSDVYLGAPIDSKLRILLSFARRLRLPAAITSLPFVSSDFRLCYALSTLQMSPFERFFPGSRFSDSEVDALLGAPISRASRERLHPFLTAASKASSPAEQRAIAITVAEAAAAFAKGLYTSHAVGMRAAYPFCDEALIRWIQESVPEELRLDASTGTNKVLVRHHIAQHFGRLQYVDAKGSFRFDLVGLAAQRFDQVFHFAEQALDVLPGASGWLEKNRKRLGNKFFASKFYLLAVVLPWLVDRQSPKR